MTPTTPIISRGQVRKVFFLTITIALGVVLVWDSWYVANAGERVVTFNRVTGTVATHDQGLHFKLPLVEPKTRYEVRSQLYTTDATAASSDLQDTTTSVAVRYRPNFEQVAQIHQQYGPDYADLVLSPAVQQILKNVTSRYTAEQLVTERPAVAQDVQSSLTTRLAANEVVVEAVDITNFRFSAEFEAAIEAKVTAKQRAEQELNNLTARQYQGQQIEVTARAVANATVINATAQAQTAKLINEAIAQNPLFLEWLKITRWDGALPRTMSGSGGSFGVLVNSTG